MMALKTKTKTIQLLKYVFLLIFRLKKYLYLFLLSTKRTKKGNDQEIEFQEIEIHVLWDRNFCKIAQENKKALGQGFSTFWYSRTPKSGLYPFAYPQIRIVPL